MVLSSFGCVLNNLLYLSQVPMLRRMIKEGDSSRFPFLPSLTLMAVMMAWSVYTVYVTPLASIMVANFPGVLINAINLILIARYSPDRKRSIKILSLMVGIGAGVLALFICVFEYVERAQANKIAGAIMASMNALFFLSPLRALFEAIRRLDVSAVPTTLSYVQLIQGSNWVAVGILYRDGFIYGVNGSGAALAIVQIALIQYVGCRRRAKGLDSSKGASASALTTPNVEDGAAAAKGNGAKDVEAAPTVEIAKPHSDDDAVQSISLAAASDVGGSPLIDTKTIDAEGGNSRAVDGTSEDAIKVSSVAVSPSPVER